MKALARYGKEFGGYKLIDIPKPECGPDDIIVEIKAAAICGADMNTTKLIMALMNLILLGDMSLRVKLWKSEKMLLIGKSDKE